MTSRASPARRPGVLRWRQGDRAFAGILAANLFGAAAASVVFLTMVWWVLAQGVADLVFGLMMLAIVVPLNLGVLVAGPAVARLGARLLLILSKLAALAGAGLCLLLLWHEALTLPLLALLAMATYAALGPSMTADVSRTPAIARLAGRRLIDFNAVNGLSMLAGSVAGFWAAGRLIDAGQAVGAMGVGVACIAISTAWTVASFPRDRLGRRFDGGARGHLAHLLRRVLRQWRAAPVIPALALLATVLLAISNVYEDVVLPLIIRDAGLAPSTHASALIASVIAAALVSVIAPAVHGRVALRRLAVLCAVAALAVLVVHLRVTGPLVFLAVVVVTTLAAGLVGTLGFTVMQERMPQSLQAQAVGVWQGLSMSVGSVTFLAGALLGTATLALLAALALGAVAFAMLARFDP